MLRVEDYVVIFKRGSVYISQSSEGFRSLRRICVDEINGIFRRVDEDGDPYVQIGTRYATYTFWFTHVSQANVMYRILESEMIGENTDEKSPEARNKENARRGNARRRCEVEPDRVCSQECDKQNGLGNSDCTTQGNDYLNRQPTSRSS